MNDGRLQAGFRFGEPRDLPVVQRFHQGNTMAFVDVHYLPELS